MLFGAGTVHALAHEAMPGRKALPVISRGKAVKENGCDHVAGLEGGTGGGQPLAEKRAGYVARGIDLDAEGPKYVKTLSKALEARPEDMTVTMHICRGSFRSTRYISGGYEPLRFIKGQKIVLGLIASKSPELEGKAAIMARIHEAEPYMPPAQLPLRPQCGFASAGEGHPDCGGTVGQAGACQGDCRSGLGARSHLKPVPDAL